MIPKSLLLWCRELDPSAELLQDRVVLGDLIVEYLDLHDLKSLADRHKPRGSDPKVLLLFSSEWKERTSQCKSLLAARVGRFRTRVGARTCKIREIPHSYAREFLEANHLQGSNKLTVVAFGLFSGISMIGAMTLGRHSRQISQNRIVLDRMCFERGIQVVGGASKLFKFAVAWAKERKYDEIISFSDNRWALGGIYKTLGFTLESKHRPDYFYVKQGRVYSKQSQKKQVVKCPPDMTEYEWASYRGFDRVYGCGKIRWAYNLRPGEHYTRTQQLSKRAAEMHARGAFKHSHIRGNYYSSKNGAYIYYGSSYELRCMYLLEKNENVTAYARCEAFEGRDRWRNPDLLVDYSDARSEIWEIKPKERATEPEAKDQISDSIAYADKKGFGFKLWTEDDSELKNSNAIINWAKRFTATLENDTDYDQRLKENRKKKRRRHYERKILINRVDVDCGYCKETHNVLRLTYDLNIARNGTYICGRYGGHLAGSKLKPRKPNPYAAECKKKCSTCKEIKSLHSFSTRKASRDGLEASCVECASARNKEKYKAQKALGLYNRKHIYARGEKSKLSLEVFYKLELTESGAMYASEIAKLIGNEVGSGYVSKLLRKKSISDGTIGIIADSRGRQKFFTKTKLS